MSGWLEEARKHRYIYVPRDATQDTLGPGKDLALALARQRSVPLTVLLVRKADVGNHPELAKQTIVTERSGSIADGGVVLVWRPRDKTMEKLQDLETSTIVLVEWLPGGMEAWAKLKRAYNVVTNEVMDAGLSEDVTEALERVVDAGYKGWHDSIAQGEVRSYLNDLVALGAYDRDLVLAYARQMKEEASVERLAKTLDTFDANNAPRPAPSSPRRLEL